MSNTRYWDQLGKTDPAHTKGFSRAGGFKGTALKPIWIIQRLTETFGPVGEGWGMGEPKFDVVHAQDGEILVYCTVRCWHTSEGNGFFGVGGDKVATKRKSGDVFLDDEAFKKAFTDAVNNAFKFLGVGADVHMGQFDDSKYVNQLRDEFTAQAKVETVAGLEDFATEIAAATSLEQLEAIRASYARTIDAASASHKTQVMAVRQKYMQRAKELSPPQMEPA